MSGGAKTISDATKVVQSTIKLVSEPKSNINENQSGKEPKTVTQVRALHDTRMRSFSHNAILNPVGADLRGSRYQYRVQVTAAPARQGGHQADVRGVQAIFVHHL